MIRRTIRRMLKYTKKEYFSTNIGHLDNSLESLRTGMQDSVNKQDINVMRKMVYWKATHLGINEVEIIMKRFLDKNMDKMNAEQLWGFYTDVIERETDFLWRELFGNK